MPDSPLKQQLTEAMKDAMRAKDKARLGAVRLILTEVKKVEVDERIDPDDARIVSMMDKMVKQRRDSIKQYQDAGRDELAAVEQAEIEVIQEFLPSQLRRGRDRGHRERSRGKHRRHLHAGHGQGHGPREAASGRPRRHGRGQPKGQGCPRLGARLIVALAACLSTAAPVNRRIRPAPAIRPYQAVPPTIRYNNGLVHPY